MYDLLRNLEKYLDNFGFGRVIFNYPATPEEKKSLMAMPYGETLAGIQVFNTGKGAFL